MNTCPVCDSIDVKETETLEKFEYGLWPNAAVLEAKIILCYCVCGSIFSDERSEKTRDAAVEQYLAGKK